MPSTTEWLRRISFAARCPGTTWPVSAEWWRCCPDVVLPLIILALGLSAQLICNVAGISIPMVGIYQTYRQVRKPHPEGLLSKAL